MNPKLSPSFAQLQNFLAIADRGSVRAAADVLGLSQPAVSKSLRALETALSATLIRRDARGSTLTPAGRLLYARARLIENEMHRASADIRDLVGIDGARVAIGASAIPSIILIPHAIEHILSQQREIFIDLVGGMPSVLLPRLLDGSLDFVIGPRPGDPLPDLIEAFPIFKLRGSIVMRHNHTLRTARTIEDFAEAEWVLSSSAAHTESALHTAYRKKCLPIAKIPIRVESLLAAYSIVAETKYVGILPRYAAPADTFFDKVLFIDVPELNLVEHYDIFVRRKTHHSTAASEALAIIRTLARKLT